jgi:hypothetical protein
MKNIINKIDFILGNQLLEVAQRADTNPESGVEKYGKVKFADPKNHKYPIDTEKHIRAAWSYISMPKNAAKYSPGDVKSIKAAIVRAWKTQINAAGPKSAEG